MAMHWGAASSSGTREVTGLRDPYLRWAEHTAWRGQRGHAEPDAQDHIVQIIARAADADVLAGLCDDGVLAIPDVYRDRIPGTAKQALHVTAWTSRDQLATLRCNDGFRWKLSQPLRDAERIARASTLGRYGPTRRAEELRADNVLAGVIGAARTRSSARAALPKQVLAVIDFGCPFLNPCFAGPDGRTRIVSLWDQGAMPPRAGDRTRTKGLAWPWTAPDAMGYGREITQPVLQAMYDAVRKGQASEDAAYRGIDYLIDYDDPRRRVWQSTHGAHVLDIAAGRRDPLTGHADAASGADIIFVQLPSITAGDSSGTSLAGYVLDAVRYVLDRSDPGAGIVVNLSYGSRAGPHDGSSLLETALDELLEQRSRNFAIVLSAGNSRRQRAHARRIVTPRRSALLRCRLAEGDTTDTFVETWYRQRPGLQMRARVRAAGGAWSPWVVPEPTTELCQDALLRVTDGREADPDAAVVGMLRHDARVPNGAGSLLLLAAAPTASPDGLQLATAEAGVWDIELALQRDDGKAPGKGDGKGADQDADADDAITIDVRIERDDPGQNAGAGTSEFVDQDDTDDEDTLGSFATGRHTIVVGGFRRSDGREGGYSSTGPRKTAYGLPPVVLAACEDDAVNPDIAAAAVATGDRFRMNGTSVAAPVLARRLFNCLAGQTAAGQTVARKDWGRVIGKLARTDPCVRLPAP